MSKLKVKNKRYVLTVYSVASVSLIESNITIKCKPNIIPICIDLSNNYYTYFLNKYYDSHKMSFEDLISDVLDDGKYKDKFLNKVFSVPADSISPYYKQFSSLEDIENFFSTEFNQLKAIGHILSKTNSDTPNIFSGFYLLSDSESFHYMTEEEKVQACWEVGDE